MRVESYDSSRLERNGSEVGVVNGGGSRKRRQGSGADPGFV